MISKAKQRFCETFRRFDGLASLRLGLVIMQIASRQRDAYLKRSVRFSIAYGRRCTGSYHFDLRHRHRPYFGRMLALKLDTWR